MMSAKCKCGNDAHPLYGGRCEDCWTNTQPLSDKGTNVHGEQSDASKKMADYRSNKARHGSFREDNQ